MFYFLNNIKLILSNFAFVIVFFLTVIFHPLSNAAGQNQLMLFVMGLCVFLLPFRIRSCEKSDFLLLAIFFLQLSSMISHPTTFRLSTVLYSGLFFIQFVVFKTYAKSNVSLNSYIQFIRFLIFLFFAVLLIQQVSELLGIVGFNRNGFFVNRWKMNSLAQEPSTLPTTITILFLSYAKMVQLKLRKNITLGLLFRIDKKLVFAAFYSVLLCGTTSGLFIFPLCILFFYRKNLLKKVPQILVALVLIIYAFSLVSPYSFERFNSIIWGVLSLDPSQMYDADQSGSARIAPYMLLLREINLCDLNFWIGHGVDYSAFHFSSFLLGKEMGREVGIGGMVNFLYDYGIIAFSCFIAFIRINCLHKFCHYDFLLWIFVFSIADLNVATSWCPLAFMYLNVGMEKKYRAEGFLVRL